MDFPESESYYSEAITLPMFPGLKNEEIRYIVSTLEKALK
jgi:dTDP-4-amino-4,6-dideoxygalactose transaminase